MPVSTMPIVTPRPSQVGLAAVKAAEPVSWIGMYGFDRGSPRPEAAAGSDYLSRRPRILERDDLDQVECLNAAEGSDRLDLVGRHAGEHVAEAVVLVQD